MRSNFLMNEKYIRMIRGDTLSFGIQITDELNRPFKQELDYANFTCKSNNALNKYLFKKTLGNGITKTGTGEYVVRVAPSDTQHVKPGKYFFDLEIGVNGDVFTLLFGFIEIAQDTTF